jgi:hypothetical protein
MRRRLRTAAGRAAYKKRKETVEPVFGIIKEAMGFRRFLLRGMQNVALEWSLVPLAYNFPPPGPPAFRGIKRFWKTFGAPNRVRISRSIASCLFLAPEAVRRAKKENRQRFQLALRPKQAQALTRSSQQADLHLKTRVQARQAASRLPADPGAAGYPI